MSELPPTIDSKTLPRTPAKEWADNTTSALSPDASVLQSDDGKFEQAPRNPTFPYFASSTSTPGLQPPGAFPADAIPSANETKNAVLGMLDSAKSYIPAQEDVQRALENAGETARQYLPQAVSSYFPNSTSATNSTSLTSEELEGDTSGVLSGVGATPGSVTEGIAELPGERTQDHSPKGVSANELDHPIVTTTNTTSHIAPDDIPASSYNHGPTTGGVGDLPGSSTETGVAILPLEASHSTTATGGVGDLPGSASESAVALLPEERNSAKDPQFVQKEAKQVKHEVVTHTQTGHHGEQSQGDSEAEKQPLLVANASTIAHSGHSNIAHTNNDSIHSQQPSVSSKSSAEAGKNSNGTAGGKRRSSLMDKIKGEAKVISGKLGKNEEKVEEGRRLLGKSSQI